MSKRSGSIATIIGGLALILATSAAAQENVFVAHLSGDEEVPAVDTTAQGQFVLRSRGDLEYKLIVANIEDVVASHIHCAPAGLNGPVGVTLFQGAPITVNGILVEGPILAPNDGNGCGWTDVQDLVATMAAGNAYVNVHTLANPPGEVRGQIR